MELGLQYQNEQTGSISNIELEVTHHSADDCYTYEIVDNPNNIPEEELREYFDNYHHNDLYEASMEDHTRRIKNIF